MPFRICKTFEIESGHMLTLHPDNCRFPHGHSRRIEVVLEADELDDRGMVCDFKAVAAAAENFLQRYDHALCVNTDDPLFETLRNAYGERVIPFEGTEPTTERLARTLYDDLAGHLAEYASLPESSYPLRGGVRLVRVRVWETSSSWAEYSP